MIRAGAAATLLALAPAAFAADAPVRVMIVADYHMAGGHDLHNIVVDDVNSPERQAELEAVTDALAGFKPSLVAVEWSGDTDERYAKYLAGIYGVSHNEVVHLGFRLAHKMGLAHVSGIDVDGDFPYDPVDAYAKAHGQGAWLDKANAEVEASVRRDSDILAKGTIGDLLRHLNDPVNVAHDNGFYGEMMHVGGGADQPGAELLTAWYHRNALICANLIQLAKPGDRIVMFYGAGHAPLLRMCVTQTPAFALVEANDYLPKWRRRA
jgi:uncharacterized protein DUF5694